MVMELFNVHYQYLRGIFQHIKVVYGFIRVNYTCILGRCTHVIY